MDVPQKWITNFVQITATAKLLFKARCWIFIRINQSTLVEIKIVYGESWDTFLKAAVKQNDSLTFIFDATDECAPYFFTMSNEHYYFDYDVYNLSIRKGAINKFEIQLKPATFLNVNVKRDTLDNTNDAVTLQIRRSQEKDWERIDSISINDFVPYLEGRYSYVDSGRYRTISFYYDVESKDSYYVRWIRYNSRHSDTLYHRFNAVAFDTVHLNYNF